ncbi:MAG: TAXI family TRAP transporter solute-binding subunit [Alphaproteobacteria bacterium]|nr:TAXI family TRAP transporter solute-binding subunit [Alphaproteobacteria bacterium]
MKFVSLTLATAAAVGMAASASAQTFGIGSTKAGAVSQITATISKAVSEHAKGVQMRKQTMGGTQQYIPVVNAGELGFGISNISQYHMAKQGIMLSKGKKHKNLRLVTTMMKFTVSPVVPLSSGISKTSQLKGLRTPTGFKGAPLFVNIFGGSLATANLTYKDIKSVPMVGLVQHWRAFMAGKIDWAIAAAGSSFVKQMNAKIKGGIRHISFPKGEATLKRMQKWFPRSEWGVVQPGKGLTGVIEPTNFVSYDFLLWTHKGLSNDVAYKVAKVMHKQAKQLKEGGPLWRSYRDNKRMAKDQGYAYHPGAVKYYKEAGLWSR